MNMKLKTTIVLGHTFLTFIAMTLLAGSVCAQEKVLRTMKYTHRSESEAGKWQKNLRTDFSRLLKINDLIASKEKISLNPEVILTENKGSYTLKEIEINSTPMRRIKVILTVPNRKTIPSPAVVCIHGHSGQLYTVYQDNIYRGFAAELARSGYITVATTVSQHNIFEKDRTLMGERLWDLMRCIDYLESLKDVDKTKIGCAGLSLGGEMAMWLGAMDTRVKAVVSSGFLTKMDQMETGHCMCWKFPGLRELVDYADIYSMIAPRWLECQNGLNEPPTDFTVPLAQDALKEIKVIYSDFGRPENVSLLVHPEGHVINLQGLMSFFNKTIGKEIDKSF
jgi:hypothetical protein